MTYPSRTLPSNHVARRFARAAGAPRAWGVGLPALVLLAAAAGCSSARAPDPPPTILTLDFTHLAGSEPLQIGKSFTTRYKQEVVFDHVRYWVTNVALARGGERFRAPRSYFLIEQTPEHDKLTLSARGIPPGTYDTLVFHIGVDPPHNKSLDMVEGELAGGIGMDWSWDTGYKFFRTEGSFVQKDLEGAFSFHVGMDVLYKELTAPLPEPIELAAGQEVKLSVEAEIDRIFAGVQLATDAAIAGGSVDEPAAQVAGNYSRMFRLVTGDDKAPFTATSPNVDTVTDDGTIPPDSTPPLLSEPVLLLPEALSCSEVPGRPASEERACTTPFQLVSASGAAFDAGFLTFVTKNGEPVRASAGGVVSDVTYIEHSMLTHSDLFTVAIRLHEDSAFWMEYRNVKDLQVAEGDLVKAGQVLGGAGDYFDASVGLVAFGVKRHQELVQRLCPGRFTTPDLQAVYAAALDQSNGAWPAFAKDSLCGTAALLCTGGQCEVPGDFVASPGDIDEGRRIYKDGCASCHGDRGQGSIAPTLCKGGMCSCKACGDHATLAARIQKDMPPEGACDAKCAADVAAFILSQLPLP